MATYSGGENYKGRRFTINRQNGQTAKDGYPHFFEWVREIPADADKSRKFETRTSANGNRYYEVFKALDGFLCDIRIEEKSLAK